MVFAQLITEFAPVRLRLPLERALGLDVGWVTQTWRDLWANYNDQTPAGWLKWWWRVRDFFFEIPETFRFRNYSHLPRMDGFLLEALLALFHRQFWRKSILKGVTSWWLKLTQLKPAKRFFWASKRPVWHQVPRCFPWHERYQLMRIWVYADTLPQSWSTTFRLKAHLHVLENLQS